MNFSKIYKHSRRDDPSHDFVFLRDKNYFEFNREPFYEASTSKEFVWKTLNEIRKMLTRT
jgi:hypothetical protein